MRINEYNNLQEFIEEYDEIDRKNIRGFMGIEFTYHGTYYRMCREPLPEDQLPTLANGHKGHYRIVIVHWKDGEWFSDFDYELIGWYETLDSLLYDCYLDNKAFAEIIMADETEIIGKD